MEPDPAESYVSGDTACSHLPEGEFPRHEIDRPVPDAANMTSERLCRNTVQNIFCGGRKPQLYLAPVITQRQPIAINVNGGLPRRNRLHIGSRRHLSARSHYRHGHKSRGLRHGHLRDRDNQARRGHSFDNRCFYNHRVRGSGFERHRVTNLSKGTCLWVSQPKRKDL